MGAKETKETLVAEIRDFFREQGKRKAVLGLSGGVDSAVVFALLCEALGPGNVTAIMMPNTAITKDANMQDAKKLAESKKAGYFIVPVDSFLTAFGALPWNQPDIARANLNARIRAVILYNYANSNDCLVAGTGNKTEYYLGYFTKYGDAAADFFPIAALLKTEVYALAKELGLPKEFIGKAPSAELWLGQEDEKELGLEYKDIDGILPLILEAREQEIAPEGRGIAEKIKKLISDSEHKRAPPKILFL